MASMALKVFPDAIMSLMEAAQQHWLHSLHCRCCAGTFPRHEPVEHVGVGHYGLG